MCSQKLLIPSNKIFILYYECFILIIVSAQRYDYEAIDSLEIV